MGSPFNHRRTNKRKIMSCVIYSITSNINNHLFKGGCKWLPRARLYSIVWSTTNKRIGNINFQRGLVSKLCLKGLPPESIGMCFHVSFIIKLTKCPIEYWRDHWVGPCPLRCTAFTYGVHFDQAAWLRCSPTVSYYTYSYDCFRQILKIFHVTLFCKYETFEAIFD